MTELIKTPFDDFIFSCMQSRLSNPAYPSFTDLRVFLMTQGQTFRACYISMKRCSTDFDEKMEEMKRGPGGQRSCTVEEMISVSDNTIMTTQSFFQFISAINQFARQLSKINSKLPRPPLNREIYFFRNKAIEHWDQYLDYGPASHGMTGEKGKLSVPFHHGRKLDFSENQQSKKLLEIELQKYVPDFEMDSTLDPDNYRSLIYDVLKRIDPKLRSERSSSSTDPFIPESLVELLYDCGLPVPFGDVEKYIAELIVYLETLFFDKLA